MVSEFTPQIQQWILATEGGYVDHEDDPGGATNMGITINTLSNWRGRKVTKEELKNISYQEVMDIYKTNYWDTIQASKMPVGISYAVFDYAVNSGAARAVKDLQRTLGFSGRSVDGIVGVQTLNALKAITNVSSFIKLYCQRRWEFLQSLRTFKTFGLGWKRRIWGDELGVQIQTDNGVADRATKLALGVVSYQEPIPNVSAGKAEPEKPSLIESLRNSETLTAVGGIISVVAGAIAGQPILQFATVLAIGFMLYKYIKEKDERDLF